MTVAELIEELSKFDGEECIKVNDFDAAINCDISYVSDKFQGVVIYSE